MCQLGEIAMTGKVCPPGLSAHLVVIPFEQLQEARLRPCCPLDSPEANVRVGPLDVAQIPEKLLDPECRALPDGNELSWLEVSPPETREVLVLQCPAGEAVNDGCQFWEEDLEAASEEDEVGVAVGEELVSPWSCQRR